MKLTDTLTTSLYGYCNSIVDEMRTALTTKHYEVLNNDTFHNLLFNVRFIIDEIIDEQKEPVKVDSYLNAMNEVLTIHKSNTNTKYLNVLSRVLQSLLTIVELDAQSCIDSAFKITDEVFAELKKRNQL